MTKLATYFQVWKLTAANAFQETFVNRATNALFMLGKTVRLAMMLVFLWVIKSQVVNFAGYTSDQLVVFFLTYQFLDTMAQVFYRGAYVFQNKIRTGEFDFYLTKPISPLFKALTGRPDVNDAIFVIPTTGLSIYLLLQLELNLTLSSVGWYLGLLVNGFVIATALHILILAIAVLTTDVDGLVWMYRDLMRLARFPVDIYLQPLRLALFFLIPVGMMITIPAQVLVNLAPSYSLAITFGSGGLLLIVSYKFWKWSLKHYTSASS